MSHLLSNLRQETLDFFQMAELESLFMLKKAKFNFRFLCTIRNFGE